LGLLSQARGILPLAAHYCGFSVRELLDEEPRAGEWLRGRTFARTLH